MKNVRQTYKSASLLLLLGIAITASAWQYTGKKQTQGTEDKHDQRDTTKSRKHNYSENEYRIDELDNAMEDLTLAMKNLKVELKGLDSLNIDAQVNAALSKIDFDKIKIETEKAMKSIDWEQMRKDVDVSLKQAEQEMKKVNLEQIKVNMKMVQDKLNSDSFREQFSSERLKKQIDESMIHAREGIEAAKKDLQNIKAFTEALQSDGLIDKKKGYKIELKDGTLIINGVTQSKEITEKYRKYYKKEDFKIVSDGEGVMSL